MGVSTVLLDLVYFLNILFDVPLAHLPFIFIWALDARSCAHRPYQVLQRRLTRCAVSWPIASCMQLCLAHIRKTNLWTFASAHACDGEDIPRLNKL
jgi:hypothetical protein